MPSASDTTPVTPSGTGSTSTTTGRTRGSLSTTALKVVGVLLLAAVLLSFPSIAANPFILSVGVVIMSYACLATSWNFVGGFTGYISLGHAAYSGLGAYATGLAGDPHQHQPVARPDAGRRDRRGPRRAHRHRQPPRPWCVLRDRLDRAGAHPAARLPVVGLLHRRLQRPAGAAPLRPGGAPARAARAVLLPPRRPARRGAAGVVADRPLPLRHRPQGDPRGRGQGPGARRADVQLQAHRLRRLSILHGARRRPVRPVVRLPRPDLPVLDPGRLLHGADEPPGRHPQPLRSAAGCGDRGLRGRVLQEPVRRLPVPPGRHGAHARTGRALHADGIIPAATSLVDRYRPQRASIRELSAGDLAEQRRTTEPGAAQADQQARTDDGADVQATDSPTDNPTDNPTDTSVTNGARR